MKLQELLTDDRAVSPVIGVILMVAITVILAAVIGTFVLGLGNNLQQTPPNANFQFEYNETEPGNPGSEYNVTAIHQGGETINKDNAGSLNLTADDDSIETAGTFNLNDGVSSGDSAEIGNVGAGTTVRVIWTAPDGGNSQTLAEGSTPS